MQTTLINELPHKMQHSCWKKTLKALIIKKFILSTVSPPRQASLVVPLFPECNIVLQPMPSSPGQGWGMSPALIWHVARSNIITRHDQITFTYFPYAVTLWFIEQFVSSPDIYISCTLYHVAQIGWRNFRVPSSIDDARLGRTAGRVFHAIWSSGINWYMQDAV